MGPEVTEFTKFKDTCISEIFQIQNVKILILPTLFLSFTCFPTEFQAVRKDHDFFEICQTPELACKITLQVIGLFVLICKLLDFILYFLLLLINISPYILTFCQIIIFINMKIIMGSSGLIRKGQSPNLITDLLLCYHFLLFLLLN